jgi:hypothetical protein
VALNLTGKTVPLGFPPTATSAPSTLFVRTGTQTLCKSKYLLVKLLSFSRKKCPTAPNPASLPRWAPVLPRALRLRTLPPCRGGLRHCHVTYGSGPHLPAEVGSDAATCSMAPDPVSRPRRVPALPCVPTFPKGHGP